MDIQAETDVAALLRQWDENQTSSSYDPVPLLTRQVKKSRSLNQAIC